MSLRTFNRIANELLFEQEAVTQFINFVLAGRWVNDAGQPYRVNIDPLLDCYSGDDLNDVAVSRDFDSIIGITTNNMPLNGTLAIYPVPNFRDSLVRSNHLTWKIQILVGFESSQTDEHIGPDSIAFTYFPRMRHSMFLCIKYPTSAWASSTYVKRP